MLMLCVHLYERLPQYLPLHTMVLSGDLHSTFSKQVSHKLETPSCTDTATGIKHSHTLTRLQTHTSHALIGLYTQTLTGLQTQTNINVGDDPCCQLKPHYKSNKTRCQMVCSKEDGLIVVLCSVCVNVSFAVSFCV